MDPVSAAGLGLGVVSLALQVFAGCIKGYQIMLDAAAMPESLEHHRIRMRFEQARLLNWGEKIGLLEGVLTEPSVKLRLHRNLIIDILLEIQTLFKDCLKLENAFDSIVPVRGTALPGDAAQTSGPHTQKGTRVLLDKTLKAFEKTKEIPKRLQWAAVKQDKFIKLVGKLVSYNDSIVSLLDRTSFDRLQEMQVQTHLVMLQLSSKIDDLRQLSLAMQIKVDANAALSYLQQTASPASTAVGDVDRGKSLSKLADFKASQTSFEKGTSQTLLTTINKDHLILESDDGTRCQATYRGEKVWIEWKEWETNYQVANWEDLIEDRVKKLAGLLSLKDKPKEFRAPDCLGFFADRNDDTGRFGLVYTWPRTSPSNATLSSLFELIKTSAKPSLTQRAMLATLLAQSLMYLHSVNWLHKGFRSDNIVFFTQPGQEPRYSSPIVSGFEYARPDLSEELTERPFENFSHDIYRHPDALKNETSRSKKSWDAYSLGIVLTEIAFWQSINEIVDVHEGQKGAEKKLRKIRGMLLEENMIARLAGTAGERYCDVVRRCLTGGTELGIEPGADESHPNVGINMLQVVQLEVVGRLVSIQL